jgi:hypothetical protein
MFIDAIWEGGCCLLPTLLLWLQSAKILPWQAPVNPAFQIRNFAHVVVLKGSG